MVLFSDNEQNTVKLPHNVHIKHLFMVKTKETSILKKQTPKNKISLELLHQRFGDMSTVEVIVRR